MDNIQEIWKDVSGYEGIYKVSNFGRVSGAKKGIMKPYASKIGYQRQMLYKNGGKGKNISIHRLVALTFIPNPNNFPEVNHKDGKKDNNHVLNLEWCSASYNKRHGYIVGLYKKRLGQKHPMSKLSNEDVEKIRSMHRLGISQKEIRIKFGISKGNCSVIINNKSRISG